MVTIGMNYRVVEGKTQVFQDAFAKVLKAMDGVAGHAESHLYRDVADPQSYLIISEWNDKGAFDTFIASDQFRAVANWGKEQILAGRPQHHVYRIEE